MDCIFGNQLTNRSQTGQAMVEFSLLLFLIMLLCVGMLFCWRLLTFQFWAQQEARYLAFENIWAADTVNSAAGINPENSLQSGSWLRRSELVSGLRNYREVRDDGSVSELLPPLVKLEQRDNKVIEPEIQYARLNKKQEKGVVAAAVGRLAAVSSKVKSALVPTAYATQKNRLKRSFISSLQDPGEPDPLFINTGNNPIRSGLIRGFESILENHGFGDNFCSSLAAVLSRHKQPSDFFGFDSLSSECPPNVNRSFATHLGQNIDFPTLFSSMSDKLEFGFAPQQAWQSSVRAEVATHFFSFFDRTVQQSRALAVPQIVTQQVESIWELATTESVQRMLTEARYVGSTIALSTKILERIGELQFRDPNSRNVTDEKQFEDETNAILHQDLDQDSILNDFSLSPAVVPIPPEFRRLAGSLQQGAVENIFFFEDNDLIEQQVNQSNKLSEVSYAAERGLFWAARRRGFTADNLWLTGRFYLVTQEWHLPRRNVIADYYTAEDDEELLQNRVKGLWLFPKKASEFLRPVADITGFDGLNSALDVVGTLEDLLGEVISFIDDSPLDQIISALEHIPFIGDFVAGIPDWPAVRVDAYPHSQELTGDRLMTGSRGTRNFENYVSEQKDFYSREANPSFN